MKPPLSPRRRRLTATLVVLSLCAVLGGMLGWRMLRQAVPKQYRPDEANSEITSDLARDLPSAAPKPRFSDVTKAAGLGGFRNFAGVRASEMPEDMGPGLAWGDFDNDGDEDLFLVSAGGALNLKEDQLLPCVLYENLGDGTFRPSASFPDLRIHGNGAAWGDYDGDGFLDLVVSGYNALLLFHNEPREGGGRKLVRDARFPNPPGFWTGVAWGDYDNDRALDLYVCGYINYVVAEEDRVKSSQQIGAMVPFTLNPASFQPGLNLLLHNNRDGTFSDLAPALKLTNPEGRSLSAVWHDFDNDGWLDLYVANDLSDNVLYHNLGGKFEDISHPALVADYRSAMGLAVGDYNRDGDDDLFISHWVAQENALYDNMWMDYHHPRAAGANQPTGMNLPLRFMDVADQKGLGQIALPYVGWGAEFADFDGDGWLDLVVANGSTIEEDGPAPKRLKPQDTLLFWNQRGEHFHNLAPLHAGLREKHVSRGLAVADFDRDGAVDLIIADLGEGVRLYRNEMQTGHWLQVKLHSRNHLGKPIGFGDGSTVVARMGEIGLRRTVSSGSYLSQRSRTLHFGLGTAGKVDRLEVCWHAGETNFFDNLETDAVYEITEGESTPRRASSKTDVLTPRARTVAFWERERAAMDAMKVEKNNLKAIPLFREAIALDPAHEDSRYYLAACLAGQGEVEEALVHLGELKRLNPQSHRGLAQWGALRALSARSSADLEAAEASLAGAHAINPEETGALLLLGEIALLRGNPILADERFAAACRTNPKAAGGFFLRGFIAWKKGDNEAGARFLAETRIALGKDWQPKGATSEGDVNQKQHVEKTPLTRFWEGWDGRMELPGAFAALDRHLATAVSK